MVGKITSLLHYVTISEELEYLIGHLLFPLANGRQHYNILTLHKHQPYLSGVYTFRSLYHLPAVHLSSYAFLSCQLWSSPHHCSELPRSLEIGSRQWDLCCNGRSRSGACMWSCENGGGAGQHRRSDSDYNEVEKLLKLWFWHTKIVKVLFFVCTHIIV